MKYNVSSVKTRFTDVYSLGFYRYQMVLEVFYRCLSSFLSFLTGFQRGASGTTLEASASQQSLRCMPFLIVAGRLPGGSCLLRTQ